jgi:hypothetical protein
LVPEELGVPLIVPLNGSKVNPNGRLPLEILHE